MKKAILLATILAFFAFTGVVTAKSDKAQGPADKATGYVMWESLGVTRYLDFNAHETYGNKEAKGMAYYWDESGNTFDVMVEGASVEDDHACFWGNTVAGTGAYASKVGQTRYWYVVDGGEPQEDSIRGNWGTNLCPSLSAEPFDVVSGNLQVHTYGTE